MITKRPTRQLHIELHCEENDGTRLACDSTSVNAPPLATGTNRMPAARQPRGSS